MADAAQAIPSWAQDAPQQSTPSWAQDNNVQSAPSLPDTQPIQNTVKQNLETQPPVGQDSMPQTGAQKLDAGLGFSASSALKSGTDNLPADIRGHLVSSYQNGTATSAGDYAQTAIPAAAAASDPISFRRSLGEKWTALEKGIGQQLLINAPTGAVSLAEMAGRRLGFTPPDIGLKSTIIPELQRSENQDFPQIHETIGNEVAGAIGGVLPALASNAFSIPYFLLSGAGQAQQHIDQTHPNASQNMQDLNVLAKGGVNTLQMFIPGLKAVSPKGQNAVLGYAVRTLKAGGQGAGLFPGISAVNDAIDKYTIDPDKVIGEGALHQGEVGLLTAGLLHGLVVEPIQAAAHETVKPIVADVVGKSPDQVTIQDINQTIAKGFDNAAPKAQDFHTVAAAMDSQKALPQEIETEIQQHEAIKAKATTNPYQIGSDGRGGHTVVDDQNRMLHENEETGEVSWTDNPNKASSFSSPEEATKAAEQANKNEKDLSDFSREKDLRDKYGKMADDGKISLEQFKNILNRLSGLEQEFATGQPATILDTLHEIYKQTGVRPDQVFEDVRNNPSVAADIAAGKIPEAYASLKPQEATGGGSGKPPEPPEPPKEVDEGPSGAKRSDEGASKSINPFAKIFNPAGMSESARDMATALRQGRGPENHDVAVIQDGLNRFNKDVKSLSDNDRLKFIDYMENRTAGAENPFPHLQDAADAIKDIYKQYADKIQEAFPDVGLRKDYFTHQYKDEAAAAKFFSDWVAKQGSERNLKERQFPTLAEAMEAGLKPRTTNPIETVMTYVRNMARLLAADKTVKLAKESGVADYFRRGEQPDGWVPLNSNFDTKEGKTLYAPEDAARVYNNDASEKANGPAGDILDAIQRFNNFLTKMVLGLSGYHFAATTMASMASDVSQATLGGATRAITPGVETYRGGKYIGAYLGRDEIAPELQAALDLAIKNNTINVKQQDYWKAGPAKDYIDVFKNGSLKSEIGHAAETIKNQPIIGPVRVIAGEIGRVMDTISKPLFDYYIPRIKIAANIDELHSWLSEHPEATPAEQDRAAQDIGNSIDNRFGEMMRDNLFWRQLTRQTMQTVLLSYSWVAGAARMLGGIKDIGSTIMSAGGKDLTSNARYLFGMAATYAVVNGVRTYIGTGQAPDDWKDFFYPRTGGRTPQGKEEREILPSHIGQYTNYLHDGLGELGNELNPGLKLIYHLISNQDWRGLPITNENNSWFSEQRWGDYLKYTLGEETPIGIKNFLQGEKKGSKISTIEQLLGSRPAPRFITDPKGYETMMKRINQKEYEKKTKADSRMKAQYGEENTP